MTTVASLQAINTAVVARVLTTLGVRTWTIDVDGVVVDGRAFRGYNPHHRKVPSYLPDPGAPGGDDAHPAHQESAGQRA
jgi:hypothetical protein